MRPKDHELDALNRAVPLHTPPAGLEDRIMAAVEQSRQKPARRLSPWISVLAAAALLLGVGDLVLLVPKTAKPGLMVVMLNGTPSAPEAFGTIVLDPDDNHGILAVRDLPVSSGKYELWLRTATEAKSAGIFEVNSDGYGALLLAIPPGFKDFHEFRLTPAGMHQVVMTGRY